MKTLLLLNIVSLIIIGCGKSPQANQAGDLKPNPTLTKPPTACPLSFPQHGLCAAVTWETKATETTAGTFTLRFWNQASGSEHGPFQDPGLTVGVLLWMNMGPGHPSNGIVKILRQGDGVYLVSDVSFSMPGDWDIRIQLKNGNELAEQAILAVTI